MLIGQMVLAIYGQGVESRPWGVPACRGSIQSLGGWRGALLTVVEAIWFMTIRTRAGHLLAQFDHNNYDCLTNPKRTAQEAHRATRWKETSDFQFECADECKYPITYKVTRGQSSVCNPSVCIPPLTAQSSKLSIQIQNPTDQTRDCSWFI